MILTFNEMGQFTLGTSGATCPLYPFLNAGLKEGATGELQLTGHALLNPAEHASFVSKETEENGFVLRYAVPLKDFELAIRAKTFPCIDVIEQRVTVQNGVDTRRFTQVAAANVHHVCEDADGLSGRVSDGSILIHLCQNKWQGEGQWICRTPDELGIYPRSHHNWENVHFRLDSVSSQSACEHYPLVIIEDKKAGKCWYFEFCGGVSWFFDVYMCGGMNARSLSVKCGGADERLGCVVELAGGTSYTSPAVAYGVTDGGFEEAVRQLTMYKRAVSLRREVLPVIFNDYMNCNWTNECDETLLPLIDKAAVVGCRVFCLDDGWQKALGLWYPKDEKFKTGGLQYIFDYIRSKGMLPGVWFEFESVAPALRETLGDDIFLRRNGEILEPHRPLGNFRSEKFLAYLNERVDALYDMGVRYIKNDHNNTEFVGGALYGENPGVCLQRNNEAFLSFIDGLKARHPDLILESCSSGAMRSDNGTLSHFNIQSVSDQEDYLLNPSVVSGSLATYPPEKAGIWCFPYPLGFFDREQGELSPEAVASMANGEQTAFNIVTALLGNLYLSGKIHQADEKNTLLLMEGVSLAYELQDLIRTGFPVYPMGTIRLHEKRPYAMGILSEERDTDAAPRRGRLLLAVWNLSEREEKVRVDLGKYALTRAEVLFPTALRTRFAYRKSILSCRLSPRTARLFLLK